jgi:hypothetical protein
MVHVDNEEGIPHYWGKTGKGLQRLITIVATTDFLLFGYGKFPTFPRPTCQRLSGNNLI